MLQCSICPPGFVCSTHGLSVPAPCNPGYACPLGSIDPTAYPCGAGRYARNSTIGSPIEDCLLCGPGLYNPVTAQLQCLACAAAVSEDRTGCNPVRCAIGQESLGIGTNCTTCPQGRFQDQSSSTPCQICPIGSYAPNRGRSSCLDCSSLVGIQCRDGDAYVQPSYWGYVINNQGEVRASPCPSGYCTGETSVSLVSTSTASLSSSAITTSQLSEEGAAVQFSGSPCGPNRLQSPDNVLCSACAAGYVEWQGSCGRVFEYEMESRRAADCGLLHLRLVFTCDLSGFQRRHQSVYVFHADRFISAGAHERLAVVGRISQFSASAILGKQLHHTFVPL